MDNASHSNQPIQADIANANLADANITGLADLSNSSAITRD